MLLIMLLSRKVLMLLIHRLLLCDAADQRPVSDPTVPLHAASDAVVPLHAPGLPLVLRNKLMLLMPLIFHWLLMLLKDRTESPPSSA